MEHLTHRKAPPIVGCTHPRPRALELNLGGAPPAAADPSIPISPFSVLLYIHFYFSFWNLFLPVGPPPILYEHAWTMKEVKESITFMNGIKESETIMNEVKESTTIMNDVKESATIMNEVKESTTTIVNEEQ